MKKFILCALSLIAFQYAATATTLKTELNFQDHDSVQNIEQNFTISAAEIRSSSFENDEIRLEIGILSETKSQIVIECKIYIYKGYIWQLIANPILAIARGKSGFVTFGEKNGDKKVSELRLVITEII